jgi:hypothetical protein
VSGKYERGAAANRQHPFVEILFSDITESGEGLNLTDSCVNLCRQRSIGNDFSNREEATMKKPVLSSTSQSRRRQYEPTGLRPKGSQRSSTATSRQSLTQSRPLKHRVGS